jgi:hypothetical protein
MARPKVSELLAQEEAGTAPAAAARPKVADLAAQEASDPGFWSKMGSEFLLPTAAFVGRQIDRVSPIMGAPMRAGIEEVRANREARGGREPGLGKFMDPEEYKDIGRFVLGSAKGFTDPEDSPDATETMKTLGFSGEANQDLGYVVPPGPYPNMAPRNSGGESPAALAGFVAQTASPVPGAGAAKAVLGATKKMAPVASMAAEGAARAVDVVTGTKAATKTLDATKTVAEGIGNAFEGAKEGLKRTFKAKQADDFGESVKVAMANGIDPKLLPEAVEFGPNSIVTRTARTQAEGIAGQPLLDKFNEGLEQVRGAVRTDVERLAGGAPLSRPEAGAVLREGFNQGVDRAFAAVNTSHRGVIAAAPELRLSQEAIGDLAPKLDDLQKWAAAKAENGLTNTAKEQGKQILRAVEKFRAKGESYAGAYEALQEIGEVAFKKTNSLADIPPDIARFRNLYGEISNAMIKTVDDAFGAGQGKALRESNAAMTKIFGDKSLLGKIGDSNLADEDLFRSLIEQGDTKRIAALKEYLEPEQLAALKGAFLDGLIKANPEGQFPFRSLHNALRQKNTVASVLFEPGELDNLQSLIKLGDKFGNAVMSTSGTGASNAIREGIREIGNTAVDASVSEGVKKQARAVGFDINETGGKAAAKRPGPGPVMSLAPRFIREDLPKFNPRARAARAYSIYDEEDEDQ